MTARKQLVRGSWFKQTPSERASYRNTLNLFFGALLGANLGTLADIGLRDYAIIVVLLAGLVMSMQLVSAARSRRYAFSLLAFYAGALAVGFGSGQLKPPGMSEADFSRLWATLGIWLGAIAVTELTPVVRPGHPAAQRKPDAP